MAPRSASPLFVEVAVPLPIDHPFTYRVPAGEEGRARIGVRVLVPFGPRKVTGLITALVDGSALAGSDYTAASGTLYFAVGELSKTFTVAVTA